MKKLSAGQARAAGFACFTVAIVAALVAFGVLNIWGYKRGGMYQAYARGQASSVYSGNRLVDTNNGAAALLVVPLMKGIASGKIKT